MHLYYLFLFCGIIVLKKYLLVSCLLLLKCELWLLGPCFSQTITANLTKNSNYTKWYIVIVYFFFRKPDHSDNVDCRYHRVQFFCSGSVWQYRISHLHSNCCKPGKIDVLKIKLNNMYRCYNDLMLNLNILVLDLYSFCYGLLFCYFSISLQFFKTFPTLQKLVKISQRRRNYSFWPLPIRQKEM